MQEQVKQLIDDFYDIRQHKISNLKNKIISTHSTCVLPDDSLKFDSYNKNLNPKINIE